MRMILLTTALLLAGCNRTPLPAPEPRPTILLITLDTTRADHLGYAGGAAATPNLDALAAQSRVFESAYACIPETLPSHISMFSGLYPGGHAVHENGRLLGERSALIAPQLKLLGYRTAACVSAFPLARGFGLERGFDHYDDQFSPAQERSAQATTERALAQLDTAASAPLFLWVHYFDAHAPYAPPEPYATRFKDNPYAGEIAYMDEQIGRLLAAFRTHVGTSPHAILVAGDHGEGLGEHGEMLHGNLLYQGTLHVPLLLAGTKIKPSTIKSPVSLRRIYDTLLGLAKNEPAPGLCGEIKEVVLAEAMKPYLDYGWSPQTMAVDGALKAIKSGTLELYDLAVDPQEQHNLAPAQRPTVAQLEALRGYPLPDQAPQAAASSDEDLARLQSLGYSASPGLAKNAAHGPSPAAMTHLFPLLDLGSAQFGAGNYSASYATYARVLAQDPNNLMVHLRQAVAQGFLGKAAQAESHFAKALELAPDALDVHHYYAMYLLQQHRDEDAAAHFSRVLQSQPQRYQALAGLAKIRERQNRLSEALSLYQRAAATDPSQLDNHLAIARLAMETRQSALALEGLQSARALSGDAFVQFLELGVCFMDLRRFAEAASCFDQVPPSSEAYPLALFKRAQVAALLHEPELPALIQAAKAKGNDQTLELIANERLFQGAR